MINPLEYSKRYPNEGGQQTALFMWAALAGFVNPRAYWMLRWLHAIPNGGLRDKVTAARLKAQGVKEGVHDVFLPYPCGGKHGLYLEIKRAAGGKGMSDKQKEFATHVAGMNYAAVQCDGYEACIEAVQTYLGYTPEFWPIGYDAKVIHPRIQGSQSDD